MTFLLEHPVCGVIRVVRNGVRASVLQNRWTSPTCRGCCRQLLFHCRGVFTLSWDIICRWVYYKL